GGLFIGALIGLVAGITAVLAISLLPAGAGLTGLSFAAIIGGFTAGGMIYGAHDFDTVGKVTGAVAASQETAEDRMKSFETGKFSEIKQEINELKAILSGKPGYAAAGEPDTVKQQHYRTTHYNKNIPPTRNKYVFWNIAAVGLVIGLAVGALLQFGGLTEILMKELGTTLLYDSGALPEASQYAFSMIAMGAIGASFGINRDIFRKLFDKTDSLFKGLFKDMFSSAAPGHAPSAVIRKEQQIEKHIEKSPIATVVYERRIEYPASDTYHRDKALASAKKALLNMDHTNSIPH
ncbi:MAG: hypothetical protein KGI29_05650, partial [Pseudomonadota bacterium]|nr:hypothetical protein [Pseudomonadota bacterium]